MQLRGEAGRASRTSRIFTAMSEVTEILSAMERGESRTAEELLPLVYDELRHLAAQKLAQEKPGQTLQATALVHEAWLRLVASDVPHWQGRRHFFGAAAEAMRRILINNARRKEQPKHGGGWRPRSLRRRSPGRRSRPLPWSTRPTCVWWAIPIRSGTAPAISSARRLRRCAEFSSTTREGNRRCAMGVFGSG